MRQIVARFAFVAIIASALASSAVAAQSPAELFAADASGMVKLEVHCGKLSQSGSGFLLGPRLVMTARHVLVDRHGKGCSASAVQDGTHTPVRVVRWMAIRVKATKAPTDLALAVLASPLAGHDFSISPTSPAKGARVIALGYALAQPLSLNQGHVATPVTHNGVHLLVLNLLEADGASGGPILDEAGRVVGLTQFGTTGSQESVDLPRLTHDYPSQLCVGIATSQTATVCGSAKPRPALLERDGPPRVCAGFTSVLPFFGCPTATPPKQLSLESGVVRITSVCPVSGKIQGAGFLLGPRLLMTDTHLLVDLTTGAKCKTTVDDIWIAKSAHVVRAVTLQTITPREGIDVSLAILDTSFTGHAFSLSSHPAVSGASLQGVDALTTGKLPKLHVSRLIGSVGVPVFVARGDTADLTGGDPIVDADDRVVGLTQFGSSTDLLSVNLATLAERDPTQFCVGGVTAEESSICPAHSATRLLSTAPAVSVCGGSTSFPPFTVCHESGTAPLDALGGTGNAAPGSTGTTTTTPQIPTTMSDCWVTPANSWEGSQRVTSVPDSTATVYFLWQLNVPASPTTPFQLSLTEPNGVRSDHANELVLQLGSQGVNGATYRIPVSLTGSPSVRPPDGVWTFSFTFQTSQTCTVSVTVGA